MESETQVPMTESVNPVPIYKILDPRIDGQVVREYICQKSGNSVNVIKYASTSNSASQTLFNISTPGANVFIDRRAMIRYSITFTFSGAYDNVTPVSPTVPASAAVRFLPRPYDPYAQTEGLRCMPLNSAASTITLNLDGTSLSVSRDDVAAAMNWYRSHTNEDWHQLSTCPSIPDEWQNYQALSIDYGNRNPFALYENEVDQKPDTGYRNLVGYNLVMGNITTSGATWSQNVTCEWMEPIMLSPLLQTNQQFSLGLYGCRQLQLLMTFSFGLWPRLWSGVCQVTNTPTFGPRTGISVVAQTANQAELTLTFITPNNTQTIPNSISWPLITELRQTNATTTPIAGGASSSVVSSSIALQGIPYQCFVFLKQQYSDMGSVDYCDSFAKIDKISLLWNNNPGLLSSDNSFTLYNRSRANGFMGSWKQWNCQKTDIQTTKPLVVDGPAVVGVTDDAVRDYGCGSVLCLRFDRDISLPSELSSGVGSEGTYQFQIEVNFTNPSTVTKTYTLYVIFHLEGYLSWRGNSSGGGLYISESSVLNSMDVLNAPLLEGVHVPSSQFYGAGMSHVGRGFWSKLRDGLKAAWNKVGKPVLKAVAPMAANAVSAWNPALAPIAQAANSAVQGMGYRAGRSSGGAKKVGGRALSRTRIRV